MNDIEIRDYKPEDYIRIQRREFDDKVFSFLPNPEISAHNLAKGPAFTGLFEGEIIACGGVLPFWKGMGEAWLVTSPLVEKFKLSLAKSVHDKLEEIIKKMKLERVQTLVDGEHITGQKFIERLGFINETPNGMRKYLGGRTYYRYALIKEG